MVNFSGWHDDHMLDVVSLHFNHITDLDKHTNKLAINQASKQEDRSVSLLTSHGGAL